MDFIVGCILFCLTVFFFGLAWSAYSDGYRWTAGWLTVGWSFCLTTFIAWGH